MNGSRHDDLWVDIIRLTKGHRWLLPLLVGLGLLAFFFEGVAIYLLWPMLQLLGGDIGASNDNPIISMISGQIENLGSREKMLAIVGAIISALILKSLASALGECALAFSIRNIGHQLRSRCFDRVVHAPLKFIEQQTPGKILNTLGTETWRFSHGLQLLSRVITHSCAVIVFLVLMLILSWQLTAVVAVGVIAIIGCLQLVSSIARRSGDAAVKANERLAARIVESLAGLVTIKLFGQEGFENERFSSTSRQVGNAFLRMEMLNSLPPSLLEVLFAVLLGALLLTVPAESLVSLLVFLALILRLQPHVVALLHARLAITTIHGSAGSVLDLLGEGSESLARRGAPVTPRLDDTIVVEDVVYTHPGRSRPTLNRVTFELPARSMTALVGASGAGKSTLLALLCRLDEPESGAIMFSGQPAQTFDLASWRRRWAMVPQDVFLFNSTIRENIAYGNPTASDGAIQAAAQKAHAHEFITSLPDGYQTHVGDRGLKLSGGQRQRIALARAFLIDPDVLILDEATNALDSMSETMVRDAIEESRRARTMIVVSHRLSSVERADHVVVLDSGTVAEMGTPSELRARDSLFNRLFGVDRLPAL